MTMESIIESGMTFGPFAKDDCFCIEKSNVYGNIKGGVKISEFLLLKNGKILVIEAKSGAPHPGNKTSFDDFINEIREKFINSMSLYLAMRLKRHSDGELSDTYKKLDLAEITFLFILVINGFEDEWLIPIKDALARALFSTSKTWALQIPSVIVCNEALARKYKLMT